MLGIMTEAIIKVAAKTTTVAVLIMTLPILQQSQLPDL